MSLFDDALTANPLVDEFRPVPSDLRRMFYAGMEAAAKIADADEHRRRLQPPHPAVVVPGAMTTGDIIRHRIGLDKA